MNPALVAALAIVIGLAAVAAVLRGWSRAWRSSARSGALAAVAQSYEARARLYGDDQFERRKYAEMWFDVYRHDVVFQLAETYPDAEDRKRAVLGLLARDFAEWFDRKFFEYVEVIKGKYSRKGFMYPLILDDFQQLWCELFTLIEVAARSGLPEADPAPLREAHALADQVVRRAGDRSGVKDYEVDRALAEIGGRAREFRDRFPAPSIPAPSAFAPPIPPSAPVADLPTGHAASIPPTAATGSGEPSQIPQEIFEQPGDPFAVMLALQKRRREAGLPPVGVPGELSED